MALKLSFANVASVVAIIGALGSAGWAIDDRYASKVEVASSLQQVQQQSYIQNLYSQLAYWQQMEYLSKRELRTFPNSTIIQEDLARVQQEVGRIKKLIDDAQKPKF